MTDPPSSPGLHRPTGAINPGPVQYKGAPLDSERGPGLGCFRFQMAALGILIVLTPLTVGRVPEAVSAILLFVTIGLLLVSGQTIIFLLRLVSADRRGRRQPLGARSPTVGQLEDGADATGDGGTSDPATADPAEARVETPIDEPAPSAGELAAPPGKPVGGAPASLEPPAPPDPPGPGPVRQ